MADSAGRKKGEGQAERESGESESHLLPFAKPYNDYVGTVQEAYQALFQSAQETYGTYVRDAQAAIATRDAEAYRVAGEKFWAAWSDLGKPMAASVGQAFDKYHDEIRSAFAAGASASLGPGCLMLVARSIAAVACHRACYPRA